MYVLTLSLDTAVVLSWVIESNMKYSQVIFKRVYILIFHYIANSYIQVNHTMQLVIVVSIIILIVFHLCSLLFYLIIKQVYRLIL